MPSLEERVAYLEGRFGDHTGAMDDLRNGFGDLRRSVSELPGEMGELRGEMNRRFEALDQKVDRHFTWLVGIQIAVLVSVVGALVGSYYR